MAAVVLDASALLCLLLGEPGADIVGSVLAEASMSTVNLAEVVSHYARNGVTREQAASVLGPLPIEHVPFDTDLAYEAGLLIPATRSAGLSLGDRACLVLARRRAIPALTAERRWLTVAAAVGVEVRLVR